MDPSPLRVISLLPSATELIHAIIERYKLDTGDDGAILVGRSHECDYPPCYSTVPALTSSKIKFTTSEDVDKQVREQLETGTGLYSVNKELLKELRPDIIVTQSLCKVCSVDYCLVEDIAQDIDPRPLVVDTNPNSLEDVLIDLIRIGDALNMRDAARAVVVSLQDRITRATNLVAKIQEEKKDCESPLNVAFLEWTVPIFPAGHWTPQLIALAGGNHPLNPALPAKKGDGGTEESSDGLVCGTAAIKSLHCPDAIVGNALPSVDITMEKFAVSNPDVIIIAPCGLDLPATRRETKALQEQPFWSDLKAVRSEKVYLADGNQMFNRPGPRLVDGLEWLVSILHDREDVCPKNFPYEML